MFRVICCMFVLLIVPVKAFAASVAVTVGDAHYEITTTTATFDDISEVRGNQGWWDAPDHAGEVATAVGEDLGLEAPSGFGAALGARGPLFASSETNARAVSKREGVLETRTIGFSNADQNTWAVDTSSLIDFVLLEGSYAEHAAVLSPQTWFGDCDRTRTDC